MRVCVAVALALVLTGSCSQANTAGPFSEAECPVQGIEDYAGEPGFLAPADALTWALESLPSLVTGPGDELSYEAVQRDAEQVDFVFMLRGDVHHTWEVILQDGRWAIGARSGCLPE